MRPWLGPAAIALGLLVSLVARADEAADQTKLAPADFAYGIELSIAQGAALQTLPVPFDVYRHARADLSDVRVFNARGEQVPHAIRTLDQPSTAPRAEQVLPLFPIFEPEPGENALEPLALHVERSDAGTIVGIRGALRAAREGEQAIAAYVLDTSRVEHDIVALRLTMEAGGAGWSLPLTVEASDDLAHFRTLVSGAVIARLEYQGERIERDRIELPATRAPFLRLRWDGRALPAGLQQVKAELAASEVPAKRERRRVRGRAAVGEPFVYEFDLGGPLPVERVQIVLPEPNTLVQAELESRAAAQAQYTPAVRGYIYRLQHEGVELQSPPADVERRRHRFFRLRVAGKGGGLGSGTPWLEVEYAPDQLLFVARGAPPFQLAYGSYKARPGAFQADELLGVMDVEARRNLPVATAKVVAGRELAGKTALRAPPPPPPLRTYALWAVLIAGALLLVVLAVRLLRKLG